MAADFVRINVLFAVTEAIEFIDGGKLIARYLPGYGPYRVTARNREFIATAVVDCRAVIVGMSRPVIANAARTGDAI